MGETCESETTVGKRRSTWSLCINIGGYVVKQISPPSRHIYILHPTANGIYY